MFTIPELPYATDALQPHLDEKTLEIHHHKHHQGYVDKLNAALASQPELFKQKAEEIVSDLNQVDEAIRLAVKNNGGGHVNHSLYWSVMAPVGQGGSEPTGALVAAIQDTFNTLEEFKAEFIAAAKSQFASGWGWLALDQGQQLKVYSTPGHETPLMRGETPLLTVDVWEHAYYLKYQNRRAEHLENFWQVINWPEVERRYEEAT